MRKDYTDITAIVDRSGSMESIKEDMEGGFCLFLGEQRLLPGYATLTLVQFDHFYQVDYVCEPLREAAPLVLKPRGMTALYDAIGKTITATGERLAAMPEAERPAKVVIMIITDGQENSSHTYTRKVVFDMIQHQQEVYSWEFIFLGADQDALAAGASLGISTEYSMTFAKNASGVSATYETLNNKFGILRGGEYVVGQGFFDAQDRAAQTKAGAQ